MKILLNTLERLVNCQQCKSVLLVDSRLQPRGDAMSVGYGPDNQTRAVVTCEVCGVWIYLESVGS